MKKPEQATRTGRRGFLKDAATAGGAAAVVVASAAATAEMVPAEVPVKNESSGYKLTEHVRDYYKTARI